MQTQIGSKRLFGPPGKNKDSDWNDDDWAPSDDYDDDDDDADGVGNDGTDDPCPWD